MKRLVVCVLLVGCGGDGGGGNVELDDLGMELGVASCSKMFDCCTDAELMARFMGITYEGQPITTEDQCVAFTNALFSGLAVAEYKDSLAMGRIEYNRNAAGDCIAAIEKMTCAEYSNGAVAIMDSSCRPFILPKVADGGGCTQDYECTSDNCVGATVQQNGPNTDGTCMPMPTAGQPCDSNCADGLYCGYDQATAMEVCQTLKANGAQCSLDRECTSEICDDTSHTCTTAAPTCDGR